MSKLETQLYSQIIALRLPEPEREHRFAAHYVGMGRGVRDRLRGCGLKDWRFDLAWPDLMFAAEIEGGGFVNGRHNRGLGFEQDCIKYGKAMELGWNIYRCTGRMISTGQAVGTIELLIKGFCKGD